MNEAVELSIVNGVADLGTANQLEAVMSTFERREPKFTDPE